MKATAKDLRFFSGRLLEQVARGQEIIITHRGRPCAKLVPLDEPATRCKPDDTLFGIWKNNKATADIQGYVAKLRRGRSV